VRIRFRKQGDLRLIGHRDLMRCLERLFRRAGLALAMSQGFHPKPRMTFPLALAVGIEGENEIVEVELAQATEPEELLPRLARQAPAGLSLQSVELLPPGSRKARPAVAAYRAAVPAALAAGLRERIARLVAAPAWPWQRPGRDQAINLRADLLSLAFSAGVVEMRLRAGPAGRAGVPTCGPRDVLAALGLDQLERQGARLVRTDVELEP
jgi:radical SAM-linked protein